MRRNYFCVIKLRNPSLHVCISSWALLKQKGASIKVHMATRWTIRHCLMLLWFKDLMNVTKEVTIHRPSVSTLLSSAFIRGDPNAATRGPFIRSLISCLFEANKWSYERTSCYSVQITPEEGTRQECRNVVSMYCNFFGYIH